MNFILQEDLGEIANTSIIDWEKLRNKKIFITGATRFNWLSLSKSDFIKK